MADGDAIVGAFEENIQSTISFLKTKLTATAAARYVGAVASASLLRIHSPFTTRPSLVSPSPLLFSFCSNAKEAKSFADEADGYVKAGGLLLR